MKQILLALLLPALSLAQTSLYPGAIDNDTSLFVTADNLQTTLSAAQAPGDSVAVVANPAGFLVNMVLTICDTVATVPGGNRCSVWEHEKITAVSGNILTVSRGFGGSSSRAHVAGKSIWVLIDSVHFQAIKDSVIKIQTALGPGLSNVATFPAKISNSYDFAAQTPGGSLGVGANTITLNPMPPGINANSVNVGRLYIFGGAGTAESVPIIGWTETTVTVTCAGAHSGAWQIKSSSAGIDEAANLTGFQGGVYVPPGLHIIHGRILLNNAQTLYGAAGPLTSWIGTDFNDGDVIVMDGGGSVGGAHDLRITNSSTPRTSGTTLKLVNKTTGFVSNVMILDAFVGLELSEWQGHISDVWIAGSSRAIYAHASGANVLGGIMSNLTLGVAGTTGYGLYLEGNSAGLQVNTLSCQGGAATVSLNPNGLVLNEILFTNLIMDSYAQAGFLAAGSAGSSNGITIIGARYASMAVNSMGFQFNSRYSHVKISEVNGASILYDVALQGTKAVDITNNRFASNGAGGGNTTNIYIQSDGAVPTSDILIANNSMGFSAGGGTAGPPTFTISVTPQAHNRIIVSNNLLRSPVNWLSTGADNILRNNHDYSNTRPTCSSTLRGSQWYTASASGSTDLFEVCAKTGADAYAWVQQISQTKGADLASANTITLTDRVHKVTGTTTVKTMNVPAGCAATCQVTIIPTGALPWDNTGNISKPAATATANLAVVFTWVAADSKWY